MRRHFAALDEFTVNATNRVPRYYCRLCETEWQERRRRRQGISQLYRRPTRGPDERWCARHKAFLPIADFGASQTYCLECQAARQAKHVGGYRLGPRGRHGQHVTAKATRTAEQSAAYASRWRAALRAAALAAYGGLCVCCGEMERLFLTIDHVHNDGAAHRKTLAGNFTLWLRRKGYPPGFQVLCFNCNLGRALNGGVCPHRR